MPDELTSNWQSIQEEMRRKLFEADVRLQQQKLAIMQQAMRRPRIQPILIPWSPR